MDIYKEWNEFNNLPIFFFLFFLSFICPKKTCQLYIKIEFE